MLGLVICPATMRGLARPLMYEPKEGTPSLAWATPSGWYGTCGGPTEPSRATPDR